MKNYYRSKKNVSNFFISIIIPIIIGIGITMLLKNFIVTSANVNGTSMEPNLVNNEKVIVWRKTPIKHLSVIVFDAHGEDPNANLKDDYYIKRVIGLPGDIINFRNNNIYINGKAINQKFINNFQRDIGTRAYASVNHWSIHSLSYNWNKNKNSFVVPKNKYFVLGDHRSVSNDSRYWGFVDKNKIMGVANTIPFMSDSHKAHNINSLSY